MFFIINKHKRIKSLLSAYLDDELKESERKLVERHLSSCHGCTQELESLRATVGLLKSVPQASPGRSFLVPAEKKSRPRPVPPIWQPIPVPVIITVLLTLALFLGDILQVLPYSGKPGISFKPSSSAPMAVSESRPQAASVSAPTPSPVPEARSVRQTAAVPRATQAEQALPESKESLAFSPDAAKNAPAGAGGAGAAPAVLPGSLASPSVPAPMGSTGPAWASGTSGGASGSSEPSLKIGAAPPVVAPASPTKEPQELEAPVPESRNLPQSTIAPVPVSRTPLPETQVNTPSAQASPLASQEQIAKGPVPASNLNRGFFAIPWRLVEILLLIVAFLLMVYTVLLRKKSQK